MITFKEYISEQQLQEGLVSDKIDQILDKIFGPKISLKPGEFEKKVGKIPKNPSTQQMRVYVSKYLDQAKVERELEELAWRNKTTVEKIKHYLIMLAGVVFSVIDPKKLGRAVGDLIIIIIKALINALLKKN